MTEGKNRWGRLARIAVESLLSQVTGKQVEDDHLRLHEARTYHIWKISQIAHTTAAEELYGSSFRFAIAPLLAAAASSSFTAAFSSADNECHRAWRAQ
jgi:hypothetical protein